MVSRVRGTSEINDERKPQGIQSRFDLRLAFVIHLTCASNSYMFEKQNGRLGVCQLFVVGTVSVILFGTNKGLNYNEDKHFIT